MPYYRVTVGHGMHSSVGSRIQLDGIPVEIYPTPVRVVGFSRTTDNATFEIEADDEVIANEWAVALKSAMTTVTEYTPDVVEDPEDPELPLDVWAKVGQWTKSIGSATTVVGSLPSEPKGIIVWGSGLSGSTMGTYDEAGGAVIGFSNGTDNRTLAYVAQDDVDPTNTNRSYTTHAFHLIDPTGDASTHHTGPNENCDITFGATDFTMTWNATTLATQGHYYVFGGDDISLVEIKDFLTGTNTTGEVIYTGLAEQNDFCIMLKPFVIVPGGSWGNSGFAGAMNTVSVHAGTDNAKSWCTNIKSTDDLTGSTSNHRLQRTNKLLHTMGPTSGSSAQQQAAEWAGWTADGFKLNWIDAPGSTQMLFTGMFVKGGHWDAGVFYQPTAIGEITTLVTPSTAHIQGIMAFSVNQIDISTTTIGLTVSKWTIGAEDLNGSRGCLAYSNQSGIWPSREATIMVNDKFMKHISSHPTAASSVTNAECVVSDIATEGEFTVDYTTADASARQSVWFALLD